MSQWCLPRKFDDEWDTIHGNRLVFLRGYPSGEWLCRLGAKLDVEYEFFYQHFSNPSQVILSESYRLPPLSLISTGTIQLSFTNIGSWDNFSSGIDLETARKSCVASMDSYLEGLNSGNEFHVCDSIIRAFHLYDLKQFSLEQMVSIQLIRGESHWTLLIWTDFGSKLDESGPGPWTEIRKHASSSQTVPLHIHCSNTSIKKIATMTNRWGSGVETELTAAAAIPDPGFEFPDQVSFFLHEQIGTSIDHDVASVDPLYAMDEVFRLYAASEHHFFNLMEAKVQEKGQTTHNPVHSGVSDELQFIKKLVDKDIERLHDVQDVVQRRGGHLWTLKTTATGRTKAAEHAAEILDLIFEKLLRRVNAVSKACQDEMTTLSKSTMAIKEQRRIKPAEGIAKVTFIAFTFVPLSFTTSFFGMDFLEVNADLSMWLWFAVSLPVMMGSFFAW